MTDTSEPQLIFRRLTYAGSSLRALAGSADSLRAQGMDQAVIEQVAATEAALAAFRRELRGRLAARRSGPKPKWTPEKEALARELIATGMPLAEVAGRLGMHRTTLHHYVGDTGRPGAIKPKAAAAGTSQGETKCH